MLTFQTYRLLNKIKSLKQPYILETPESSKYHGQVLISDYALFDYEYFKNLTDENIDIKATQEQLEYLVGEGYINLVSDDKMIEVTHKGLHHWQISFHTFLRFFFKSIAIPIVVSLITSYLASKYII